MQVVNDVITYRSVYVIWRELDLPNSTSVDNAEIRIRTNIENKRADIQPKESILSFQPKLDLISLSPSLTSFPLYDYFIFSLPLADSFSRFYSFLQHSLFCQLFVYFCQFFHITPTQSITNYHIIKQKFNAWFCDISRNVCFSLSVSKELIKNFTSNLRESLFESKLYEIILMILLCTHYTQIFNFMPILNLFCLT